MSRSSQSTLNGTLGGVSVTLVAWGQGLLGTGITVFLFFLPTSESLKNIGVGLGILGLLLLLMARQVPRPPLFWPLAGFLAIALVVTPGALEPWESLKGAWDVLRFSLTYVMVYTYCRNTRKLSWVVGLMLAAAASGMAVGLVDYARGEVHFERLQIRSLGYPNQTATSLAMYLGLVMGFLAFGKVSSEQRAGLAALAGVLLLGILLTYSRGAWIALIGMGILLVVLFFREGRFRSAALVVAVALSLLAVGLLHPGIRQRLHTLKDPTETVQMQERFRIWQRSLAVIRERPVLGIGLRNMRHIDHARYGFTERTSHAHNQFLITTMEMGTVGLLGLLAVLGAYARFMLRSAPRPGDVHGPYWFASLAAGLTWVTVGMVNLSYHAEPAMLFWTLTAMAAAASHGTPRGRLGKEDVP